MCLLYLLSFNSAVSYLIYKWGNLHGCRFISIIICVIICILTTALIFLMHYTLEQWGNQIFINDNFVYNCLFQIIQSLAVIPAPSLCHLQWLYSLPACCVICLLVILVFVTGELEVCFPWIWVSLPSWSTLSFQYHYYPPCRLSCLSHSLSCPQSLPFNARIYKLYPILALIHPWVPLAIFFIY